MADESAPVLLQVCPNDHPPFADICRYYEAAARALSWTPVTVMLEARAPAPEPAFHYLRESFRSAAGRLLAGRRPQLTLCHRHRAYRSAVASGLAGPRIVTVAHEFGLLKRRGRRLRRRLDDWLHRPTVTFAGVSDAVCRELEAITGRALLMPNGVDLARADRMRLEAGEARKALGLPEGGFTIGVIGRLHPKKQPGLAVEGFRRAMPQLEQARLVFLGDGQLAAELAQQAAGLPVVFKGFVSEAARLIPGLDLLLMPSGVREAFGMVALEAMTAGVPVLCGPAPGPCFVTGDTGLRFDDRDADSLAEALKRACADHGSGALELLAHRARRRVEETFSVAAGARRLNDIVSSQAGTQP